MRQGLSQATLNDSDRNQPAASLHEGGIDYVHWVWSFHLSPIPTNGIFDVVLSSLYLNYSNL
jgi:hypothetical protein